MANILNTETVTSALPTGQSIAFWVLIFLIFSLLVVGGSIWIGVWMYRRKHYIRIVKAEDTPWGLRFVARYRARENNLRNGVTYFYIPRLKRGLPRGSVQIEPNVYLYHVGKDTVWRNASIERVRDDPAKYNLRFEDTDMRMANSELSEQIQNEFKEKSWWQQYGVYVSIILVIVLMGVFVGYSSYQGSKTAQIQAATAQRYDDIIGKFDQIIANMDRLGSTGSIAATATATPLT